MPAEWEPQAAVWLSWPHRLKTWPRHFRPIPPKFAGIVAQISRREKVRINLARPLQKRARELINRARADLANVEFFDHPTNDAWCRDHGPIFVKNDRTGEVALTDWRYNAWGGKYPPYDRDDAIPPRIAAALGLRRFPNDMVLEGGSIDVNGAGTILTTEECLLSKVQERNPHMVRDHYEKAFAEYLGAPHTIWLGRGIHGDDTHGHVDDLTRFVSRNTVVTMVEHNSKDENHAPLLANLRRLQSARDQDGRQFTVVELPMPQPVVFEGRRLPASYANFYIANGLVLAPVFNRPNDRIALNTLAELFPTRQVVPIYSGDFIWGLGAMHCMTQQQPIAD